MFSADICAFWQYQVCLFFVTCSLKKSLLPLGLAAAFSFGKVTAQRAASLSQKPRFWALRGSLNEKTGLGTGRSLNIRKVMVTC